MRRLKPEDYDRFTVGDLLRWIEHLEHLHDYDCTSVELFSDASGSILGVESTELNNISTYVLKDSLFGRLARFKAGHES